MNLMHFETISPHSTEHVCPSVIYKVPVTTGDVLLEKKRRPEQSTSSKLQSRFEFISSKMHHLPSSHSLKSITPPKKSKNVFEKVMTMSWST